jgi:hypothetical protein
MHISSNPLIIWSRDERSAIMSTNLPYSTSHIGHVFASYGDGKFPTQKSDHSPTLTSSHWPYLSILAHQTRRDKVMKLHFISVLINSKGRLPLTGWVGINYYTEQ